MRHVLVVDDKEMMRESVGATLERAGFEVQTASDATVALEMIARRRPDAVITDMRMPGMTGVELVEQIVRIDEDLPVILMTAFGTIDTAVRAMRLGAFDYLTKPFEGDELVIAVKRAIDHREMRRENAVLRVQSQTAPAAAAASGEQPRMGVDRLIGQSPAMRLLREQIMAVADSQGTVLITGESGVGKEVVARAVHESSPRIAGPMLAVNCAALSESLLESELFGHERGAFTGAEKLRKGRFELADSGTLLLDEVSEISPSIQAKLLRVLQERAFERVGSSVTIGVDVRVVCTSNRDLPASVASGEFRRDLYFRLNVLPLRIPALRERREDVGLLASHFVSRICAREGRPELAIEPRTLEVMQAYDWPGNVRELQNICERAVVLSGARDAAVGCLRHELVEAWLSVSTPLAPPPPMVASPAPVAISAPAPILPVPELKPGAMHGAGMRVLEDVEREAILDALQRFSGHRQRTAAALGIGVRTLGLKLKKWKEQGVVNQYV
jgi:two-component system, NtrC family, response regulator HydG